MNTNFSGRFVTDTATVEWKQTEANTVRWSIVLLDGTRQATVRGYLRVPNGCASNHTEDALRGYLATLCIWMET